LPAFFGRPEEFMAPTDKPAFTERPLWGAILIFLYALLVSLPIILVFWKVPEGDGNIIIELGKAFALSGFAILTLQFVLASRLRWLARPFGLEILLRYHKAMAIFGGILILLHPILLAVGSGYWELLYGFKQPWYILLGKLAFLLLLVQIVTSINRQRLHLKFERWRLLHNLAPLIFLFAFIHSLQVGEEDLGPTPLQILWWTFFGLAALTYGYHKVYAPLRAKRKAYRVSGVKQESPDTWTLSLQPPPGASLPGYRPGQFQFVVLWRGERGLPVEEHHFTIASSPEAPELQMTIKSVGDFTATIRQTQPGDKVSVEGPFGRFSYTLHPQDKNFVFLAGGIGITPLMSMLRHMRDTQADISVLLIWGNKSEADIIFKEDLEAMAAGEKPRLQVVHILSQPGADWSGEKGYLCADFLRKYIKDGFAEKIYYICGPPVMTDLALRLLRGLGVPADKIDYEQFWL
jgi:predicted ferric reductase